MKTRFLFPYWCKFLGIAFFLVHLPIYFFRKELGFTGGPSVTEVGLFGAPHVFYLLTNILMLAGLVLFAFSKEKVEDEQIAQLRMDSLQWAVYLSYIILVLWLAVTTDRQDTKDIIHTHMWAPLLIFIVLFRYKMFRNCREIKEDAA